MILKACVRRSATYFLFVLTATLCGFSYKAQAQNLSFVVNTAASSVSARGFIDGKISIANPSSSSIDNLELRLIMPGDVRPPFILTGGAATCVGGSCDDGEILTWDATDLGSIPAGTSLQLRFRTRVVDSADDGDDVAFEVQLYEDSVLTASKTLALTIESNAPLELDVNPSMDPIPPSGFYEYVVTYENSGDNIARDSVVSLPIPDGVAFVSATGGGVFSDDQVVWNLGDVAAAEHGQQRVRVQVDSGAPLGSLIVSEGALLEATIASVDKQATASVVAMVADPTVLATLTLNDVEPNNLVGEFSGYLTLSNPGLSPTGDLSAKLYFSELVSNPLALQTINGDCSGDGCRIGDQIVWDETVLGILEPGERWQLDFTGLKLISDLGIIKNGARSMLPVGFEIFEDGQLVASNGRTLFSYAGADLKIQANATRGSVPPGGDYEIEVFYSNEGDSLIREVLLAVQLPEGLELLSTTANAVAQEGKVSWVLGELLPGEFGMQALKVHVRGGLAEGELIHVDNIAIEGLKNEEHQLAISQTLTHLALPTIDFELELSDVVRSADVFSSEILIGNTTDVNQGSLDVRVTVGRDLAVATTSSEALGLREFCTSSFLQVLCKTAGDTLAAGEVAQIELIGVPSRRNGSFVPFNLQLYSENRLITTIERTLQLASDSDLSLAVDATADAVVPGESFEYLIALGNAGTAMATNAKLSFTLPPEVTFLSTETGGTLIDKTLTWDLGDLLSSETRELRIAVRAQESLVSGDLLATGSIRFDATIANTAVATRASIVTRIDENRLNIGLELDTDPVDVDGLIVGQIVVSNPAEASTGLLEIRVAWPDKLEKRLFSGSGLRVTDGGECTDSGCAPGFLIWDGNDLGSLAAGESLQLTFTVDADAVAGKLIPFDIALYDDGALDATLSRTLIISESNPLSLAVNNYKEGTSGRILSADPVEAGDTFLYALTYGNRGDMAVSDAAIVLPLPHDVVFERASGNGSYDSDGHAVTWNLQNSLVGFGGGRVQAEVSVVDAARAGDLLTVTEATLSAEVAGSSYSVAATSVSRVGETPLELSFQGGFDEDLGGTFSSRNSSSSTLSPLLFFLTIPEGVRNSYVTNGAVCDHCGAGGFLYWSDDIIGPLAAGDSADYSVTTISTASRGQVVTYESELRDNGRFAAGIEFSSVVGAVGAEVNFIDRLKVSEAGTTDGFSMRLNSPPTSSVSFSFRSSDTSEATVSPSSVTFTPSNWSEPQTVLVSGVDDTPIDGDIDLRIIVDPAVSADGLFAGLDPIDVPVTNFDDDVDSDDDGLTDSEETLVYNTNPNSRDTDLDGMPDGYEVTSSFDPLDSQDASGDADLDGFTNLEEFEAGSDPRNATDQPLASGFSPALLFIAACQKEPRPEGCE